MPVTAWRVTRWSSAPRGTRSSSGRSATRSSRAPTGTRWWSEGRSTRAREPARRQPARTAKIPSVTRKCPAVERSRCGHHAGPSQTIRSARPYSLLALHPCGGRRGEQVSCCHDFACRLAKNAILRPGKMAQLIWAMRSTQALVPVATIARRRGHGRPSTIRRSPGSLLLRAVRPGGTRGGRARRVILIPRRVIRPAVDNDRETILRRTGRIAPGRAPPPIRPARLKRARPQPPARSASVAAPTIPASGPRRAGTTGGRVRYGGANT